MDISENRKEKALRFVSEGEPPGLTSTGMEGELIALRSI